MAIQGRTLKWPEFSTSLERCHEFSQPPRKLPTWRLRTDVHLSETRSRKVSARNHRFGNCNSTARVVNTFGWPDGYVSLRTLECRSRSAPVAVTPARSPANG